MCCSSYLSSLPSSVSSWVSVLPQEPERVPFTKCKDDCKRAIMIEFGTPSDSPLLGTEFPDRAHIHDEIRAFILQEDYPCVAAIKSVIRNDQIIGIYGKFGSGTHWQRLRVDLRHYVELQRATQSRYLSFWAVYTTPNHIPDNEVTFEEHLWYELSLLSSKEERSMDWSKDDSSDPNDPSFCLSLDGEKLFVVGLHPHSSRAARRFSRPTMVFNTLSQFEQFEKDGTYKGMVNTIRRRDL